MKNLKKFEGKELKAIKAVKGGNRGTDEENFSSNDSGILTTHICHF